MEKFENVIQGLECRKNFSGDCDTCMYHRKRRKVGKCASDKLMDDAVELLKWQQGEIERLTEQLEKGCDICSNKMLKEEQNDTGIRPCPFCGSQETELAQKAVYNQNICVGVAGTFYVRDAALPLAFSFSIMMR